MEARNQFRYVDRVPVLYGLLARYFAPLFNLRYIDFFKDVETHYYWQLQFAKYRIENIPEDYLPGADDLRPSVFRQRHSAQRARRRGGLDGRRPAAGRSRSSIPSSRWSGTRWPSPTPACAERRSSGGCK